jgi:uncharacterized protein
MPTRFLIGLFWMLALATLLPAQSSVWKVTRGGSTLYLGGTCHILRPEDFPLPAEFDIAYAASTKLFFETDVERMLSDELEDVIAKRGMYTDGRTLEGILTPHIWKDVQRYAAKSGVSDQKLRRMKPWLLVIMMAGIEMQKLGITNEGVDFFYYKKAKARRKGVGELETFEAHIEFLTQLGTGRESEMIAQTLEDLHEVPDMMSNLLAAWRAGNVEALDELMLHDMRSKYPAIFDQLLVSRNNAWMPKIEDLLRTSDVEFILVGVGHMAGPEGLLAQLRQRGYSIEQIKAPAPARK